MRFLPHLQLFESGNRYKDDHPKTVLQVKATGPDKT